MNLVTFALRRPFTVVVCFTAVVFGAIMGIREMPRDIFPSLGIPTIYVAQPYGGMDPSQMEAYMTYFYEYHFLYISGVEHVESRTVQGASLLKLQFHPGTDMSEAMSETVAEVDRSRAFMPPGTVPPFVLRFDAGSVPVGYLVVSSRTRTVAELQDSALNLVRPLFATLPGVSSPPPFGGSARAIVVNVDPERLRAYNLSIDQVVSAIADSNYISPSGNATIRGKYPIVPVNSVVTDIHKLDSVPIRSGHYPAVFVKDIAQVVDSSDIVTCYALVNGRRTVYIPVTKRSDASTLAVVQAVKENLPRFQSVLPSDMKVSYEFDQAPYVTRAIAGLTMEGALGAILTGIMVLVFLLDWRSVFIVILNIPLALLGAVLALWLTGQTVNIMTLGGLALAVGILVDMSTVAIENIHTHLHMDKSVARAVADSGKEVALPLLIAMLCVLAVFLPSFFMVGAAKGLFVPLSLAVGFSMVTAYILAGTLVNVLGVWMLKKPNMEKAGHDRGENPTGFAKFQSQYAAVMRQILRSRGFVIVLYLVLCGGIIWEIGTKLGTDIFPKVDAGQIQVRIRAPSGTDLDGTEALALKTLDIIGKEVGPKNVDITLGFVGIHSPNYAVSMIYLFERGVDEAVVQVQLKHGVPIKTAELQERLRKKLKAEMPNVNFSFEPSDIVSRVMALGSSTPIEVAVYGPDLPKNYAYAKEVKARLEQIPELRDIQFGQELEYPTVKVELDRERGGILGVETRNLTNSITPCTSSSRFTKPIFWGDLKRGVAYQIQVQVPQEKMNSIEEIRNVLSSSQGGKSVLLRNVAGVHSDEMVGEYDHFDMQRLVSVTANIHGADLGTVSREVKKALAEIKRPPLGVSVALRGQVVPLDQMFEGLQTGLVLAIVVIFLLLVANFQSIKLAAIVVSTVPAVIAGVVTVLWATETTLNIQSFMGAIMSIGVAVSNAIILVTFAERSRMAGMDSVEAAVDGARSRLRPILMTSLAMLAGMLPMALGLGEGGQQTAPLGRAVEGGLLFATFATLVVLPSVFAIVQARTARSSSSLDPEDPSSPNYPTEPGPGEPPGEPVGPYWRPDNT
ncbi:MAG: efflux RND transporter permease subunit [Desulfomonilaceae bacterium]